MTDVTPLDSVGQSLPLYTIYTSSHERLHREWLEPTVPSDLVFRSERLLFEGSEIYRSEAWLRAIQAKVDYIIAAARENTGGTFVFADADVQLFRPFSTAVAALLGDDDIACQSESPAGTFCTGFFICRSSLRVERFWQDIALRLKRRSSKDVHDQDLFNDLARSDAPRVQCRYLPFTFLGGGTLTGRRWRPGQYLPVPRNVIMHHANFTVGLRNKVAQLEYVRNARGSWHTLTDAEVSELIRDWRPVLPIANHRPPVDSSPDDLLT